MPSPHRRYISSLVLLPSNCYLLAVVYLCIAQENTKSEDWDSLLLFTFCNFSAGATVTSAMEGTVVSLCQTGCVWSMLLSWDGSLLRGIIPLGSLSLCRELLRYDTKQKLLIRPISAAAHWFNLAVLPWLLALWLDRLPLLSPCMSGLHGVNILIGTYNQGFHGRWQNYLESCTSMEFGFLFSLCPLCWMLHWCRKNIDI